ncbi:MAG: hypothetical protein ACTHOJ_03305 [Sphingomonas oligoaromativorans]|jgi:hypothetical protein|uniref:hypothetical protein n=1 Tax=Sphingomonas oligoaromativorans TaxID=575322 RepID=UPI001FB98F7A|nr:hypothetical protein [Sphingomonas oligoaromativorans]NIJ34486.1 hypothetical protein [Sphingomonas oligoaromativorans]
MKRSASFFAASLALAGLLAGCSTVSPEARVRDKLIAAGVKPHMAGCMADKLVHKLDTSELKELNRVARLPREHPGALSFDELTYRLHALNNPHIVSVVTRAGLGCAIAG